MRVAHGVRKRRQVNMNGCLKHCTKSNSLYVGSSTLLKKPGETRESRVKFSMRWLSRLDALQAHKSHRTPQLATLKFSVLFDAAAPTYRRAELPNNVSAIYQDLAQMVGMDLNQGRCSIERQTYVAVELRHFRKQTVSSSARQKSNGTHSGESDDKENQAPT